MVLKLWRVLLKQKSPELIAQNLTTREYKVLEELMKTGGDRGNHYVELGDMSVYRTAIKTLEALEQKGLIRYYGEDCETTRLGRKVFRVARAARE